jgi:transposase
LLAREAITLRERIRGTDKLIEHRFHRHRYTQVITSMPGIGPLLGAEFLVATGGDMTWFATADRLAGFAWRRPCGTPGGSAATCTSRGAITASSTTSALSYNLDLVIGPGADY